MKRIAICVGFFGAGLIGSLPAGADPVRLAQDARLLPAYEIRTIVRSTGLDPIGPAMRRGWNYVMRALDEDGRELRVVVDARRGEVLSIVPIGAPRPFPPGPRIATVPPPYDGPRVIYGVPNIYDEEDDGPLPRPPRVISRLPSAPVSKPRQLPLPRPRPPEASVVSTGSITPAASAPPAANAAPAAEPKRKETEVPPVAPLDPQNHGPIPN